MWWYLNSENPEGSKYPTLLLQTYYLKVNNNHFTENVRKIVKKDHYNTGVVSSHLQVEKWRHTCSSWSANVVHRCGVPSGVLTKVRDMWYIRGQGYRRVRPQNRDFCPYIYFKKKKTWKIRKLTPNGRLHASL